MAEKRTRILAPGIVETVDSGPEDDGAQPRLVTPFANSGPAMRPSDAILAKHGLKFDRVRATYVNADDGTPANIEPELYKKLFGVTHKSKSLIISPR